MEYLSEAFKELKILDEDVFDLDKEGLEDLRDFQDEDEEEEVIDVYDPDAETEEELEDSYVGKVILDCSVCHTDIYKDKEDVIIDEETQLANVGEECPYCFSIDGFKVIGEVKPFVETEFETEDDVDVSVDGEKVEVEEEEESLRKKRIRESISKIHKKALVEKPIYALEPRYDARKSFYGKAHVDTGDNNDKNKLYSYDTLVAEIKDGKPVVYGTYSATTLRHIKDWLKQNGFRADTSKQILADYGVKDEACHGRKSKEPVKESKTVRKNVSRKSLKEGWRGTPVKMVSHGSWGDPDLVWNNGEHEYTFNYWDIEDAMWNDFLEYTGHNDSESNDPKVEAEFDEFVQDNYDGYLEDVIAGGYFDEGSYSWHDRYKRESLKKRIRESCSINQCQKWVDYDMKKYKKISDDTMEKIKSSGYSVVKDQYGDYEVIADRKDTSKNEACGEKRKSRKMKESKVPMKMSRKSLKEDWNTKDVERFLKGAVKDIMDEKGTCATMKLDNRLAVCVGWSDGYYDDDVSVIHAKNDPEWGMNAGIKVWTSDSMRTDFDFINAPYDEDTGDVWDTSVSISPDEDYASLASYFEKEYDEMKEYEIDKDGKIVGKWSDDEEFEESLKNKKSRKMKESLTESILNENYKEDVFNGLTDDWTFQYVDIKDNRYDLWKKHPANNENIACVIFPPQPEIPERYDAEIFSNNGGYFTVNGLKSFKAAENWINRTLKQYFGIKEVSKVRKIALEKYGVTADRKMKESIEDITIDTGDQEISVSARDKEKKSDEEMIAPLSDEMKADIEMNSDVENGEDVDVEMDEFSEEDFDELGESYLKKVYENVNSYKTTSVKEKNNKLYLEGIIKFSSGKEKKTSFVFEAKTIDKDGHAKFLGENLQISRGHKAFKLSGTISNRKFISESLNYNYRAKNGNSSQRVYGTVRVNKK